MNLSISELLEAPPVFVPYKESSLGYNGGMAMIDNCRTFYAPKDSVIKSSGQIYAEVMFNYDGEHVQINTQINRSTTHLRGSKIFAAHRYEYAPGLWRTVAAGCFTPDRQFTGVEPRLYVLYFGINEEDMAPGRMVKLSPIKHLEQMEADAYLSNPRTGNADTEEWTKVVVKIGKAIEYLIHHSKCHLFTFVGDEMIRDNIISAKVAEERFLKEGTGGYRIMSKPSIPNNGAQGSVFIHDYKENIDEGKISFNFAFYGVVNGEHIGLDEEGRGSLTPTHRMRVKGFGNIKGDKKRLSFVFSYKQIAYVGHIILPIGQKVDMTRGFWLDSMQREVTIAPDAIESAKLFEVKTRKLEVAGLEYVDKVFNPTDIHVKTGIPPIDKKVGVLDIDSYQRVMKVKLLKLAETLSKYGVIEIEQEKTRSFVVRFRPVNGLPFRIRVKAAKSGIEFWQIPADGDEKKIISYYPDEKKKSYEKLEANIKKRFKVPEE